MDKKEPQKKNMKTAREFAAEVGKNKSCQQIV